MIRFTEAIKLKDGILHHPVYHQARVNRTVSRFHGKNIDLSVLHTLIPPHAAKGLFKCRVTYSDTIENVEFIPYVFRTIQTAGIVIDHDIDYAYKYADRSRLNELLAHSGYDDIIIVKNGLVTDASASNLVFESSGSLYTPESCLLPGTKRQYLLDRGIIKEKRITFNDISHYDRVLFVNAMIDIEDTIGVDIRRLSIPL